MDTTNNTNIGLDIDGVLADFNMAWHLLFPEVNPRPDTWCFDDKNIKRFEEMIANGTINEFYRSLMPLIKPEELPFEPVCYITSRPNNGITKEWLDLHGFPSKPVICVGALNSKVAAAKEHKVDMFVDDNYDNFVELNQAGIFCYLYTAPWNIKYDVGNMRLNSLKDLAILI